MFNLHNSPVQKGMRVKQKVLSLFLMIFMMLE